MTLARILVSISAFAILPNGLVIFGPMNWVLYLKDTKKYPLHWLLPLFWVCSGILAAFAFVVGKWVLVGKKKEGKTMLIWSSEPFMDTIW